MSSKTNDRAYSLSRWCLVTLTRPLRPWPFLLGIWTLLANLAYGQFVYVNNNSIPNQVSAFQVDPTLGTLTLIGVFPTGGNGGAACFDIGSITQVGTRLYVSNWRSGNVSGFDINPGGFLANVSTSDPGRGGPVGLAASSDGKFLFVGRGAGGGGIDVFSNNADGSFSLVSGSPFGEGEGVGFDVIYDPLRNNVISDDGFNSVGVFHVEPSGALANLHAPFTTPTSQNQKMALSGNCLWVAGGIPGEVSVIKVMDGPPYLENAPAPYSPIATGDFMAIGAAVTPVTVGNFVYFGGFESIAGFTHDMCALAPILPVFSSFGPFSGLTADSAGKFLFAVNPGDNTVISLKILEGGLLELIGTQSLGIADCPGGIVYVDLPAITVPTTANACKNGGWKTLFRADGTPFKNQGDCIQYVNAGK